jgi:hypothetical protein
MNQAFFTRIEVDDDEIRPELAEPFRTLLGEELAAAAQSHRVVASGSDGEERDGLPSLTKVLRKTNKPAFYWRRFERNTIGAPGRIRTCDTGFRRAVLYPLSYEGPLGAYRKLFVSPAPERRRPRTFPTARLLAGISSGKERSAPIHRCTCSSSEPHSYRAAAVASSSNGES